jgi:hypothetical protein
LGDRGGRSGGRGRGVEFVGENRRGREVFDVTYPRERKEGRKFEVVSPRSLFVFVVLMRCVAVGRGK